MATNENSVQPNITGAKTKKYEPGFNAKGMAYPGVDPDTGERKAVTWIGLREEFGEREGSRLYNDLANAAFGRVQPGKPALSLATLYLFRARLQNKQGVFIETEDEHAKVAEKFKTRRELALKLLANAEAKRAKENN
jgi:hypothetical protein